MLSPGQVQVVSDISDAAAGRGRASLLLAPPGWGKTAPVAALRARFGLVLVISPLVAVCVQWTRLFGDAALMWNGAGGGVATHAARWTGGPASHNTVELLRHVASGALDTAAAPLVVVTAARAGCCAVVEALMGAGGVDALAGVGDDAVAVVAAQQALTRGVLVVFDEAHLVTEWEFSEALRSMRTWLPAQAAAAAAAAATTTATGTTATGRTPATMLLMTGTLSAEGVSWLREWPRPVRLLLADDAAFRRAYIPRDTVELEVRACVRACVRARRACEVGGRAVAGAVFRSVH